MLIVAGGEFAENRASRRGFRVFDQTFRNIDDVL